MEVLKGSTKILSEDVKYNTRDKQKGTLRRVSTCNRY